jgi:hypothetical protein
MKHGVRGAKHGVRGSKHGESWPSSIMACRRQVHCTSMIPFYFAIEISRPDSMGISVSIMDLF